MLSHVPKLHHSLPQMLLDRNCCIVRCNRSLDCCEILLKLWQLWQSLELCKGRLVAGLHASHELHIWADALSVLGAIFEDAWWNACCCSSSVEFCLSLLGACTIWESMNLLTHIITDNAKSKDLSLNSPFLFKLYSLLNGSKAVLKLWNSW